jgi:hypothetical protein
MKSLRAWVLLAALPLAGCGALRGIDAGDGTAAVTELRGGDTEPAKVLAHYARARQLAGPELAREQEAARRALARTKSDANRMRYALLLTLAPAGEEARALELLEPVTRNGESALRGLALLMTALLQEQRRLDANAQGLQQKLDALLTLERSMTGREGGAARKK